MNSMMMWIILGVVMVLSYIVQMTLRNRFAKYSRVRNSTGLTGAQVAQKMLADHGIHDVQIVSIPGSLTDHYNPQTKTVNLSRDVYSTNSIAAAAVAAHECGHVIQHATGYAPLRLRSALVPVVSFASNIVSWVLLVGIIFINVFPGLLWLGIALFAMTTLFSIITLPVEVNASSRAVAWLSESGIADSQVRPMAVDALKWAAYTYFISAISSIGTLLYYLIIATNRR